MAARISFLLLLIAGTAHADSRGLAARDEEDQEIIGDDGPSLEDFTLRTSYLQQRGHGFQSQDGALPGKESMTIFQPSALVTIRQSEHVVHQIAIPIDAITAASPDAVDATTAASRRNVAGDFDLRSTIKRDSGDVWSTRFVAHVEEWIGGGTAGVGWRRPLADDNATISINGTFGLDVFDSHNHFGTFLGKTARATSSLNVGGSQLLSPTTVLDGSYGATLQHGYLKTGWNSVPTSDGSLEDEVFPRNRLRHSVTARISQIIPATRSTVKVRYGGYFDSFGLRANSIEAALYQYLGVDWLYARGSYRYYKQNGADFFTTSLMVGFDDDTTRRTADSDLAPLHSNEYTLSLATVRGRGPLGKWSVAAELFRYKRSNDLQITSVSFAFGRLL